MDLEEEFTHGDVRKHDGVQSGTTIAVVLENLRTAVTPRVAYYLGTLGPEFLNAEKILWKIADAHRAIDSRDEYFGLNISLRLCGVEMPAPAGPVAQPDPFITELFKEFRIIITHARRQGEDMLPE